MTTTVIRNADWVIAWQGEPGRHVYMRDVDVAFDGNVYYLRQQELRRSPPTRWSTGANCMVMPGLVNLHSHPEPRAGLSRRARGARRAQHVHERAVRALAGASMLPTTSARAASAEFAYCELLKSGVTTPDRHLAGVGWAGPTCSRKSGLRGLPAPGYASARWKPRGRSRAPNMPGTRRAASERFEAALEGDRRRCRAPIGPPLRGGLADADRHLHHRPAARQPCGWRKSAGSHSRCTSRRASSEVREMIRRHGPDPDRLGRIRSASWGRATILGHAHLPRHPLLGALVYADRPQAPR